MDLGSHEHGRPDENARLLMNQVCTTKINDFHITQWINHGITGFDIAVKIVGRMQGLQARKHLPHDVDCHPWLDAPPMLKAIENDLGE